MSPDYTGTEGFEQPLEGPRKQWISATPAHVTTAQSNQIQPGDVRPKVAPGRSKECHYWDYKGKNSAFFFARNEFALCLSPSRRFMTHC